MRERKRKTTTYLDCEGAVTSTDGTQALALLVLSVSLACFRIDALDQTSVSCARWIPIAVLLRAVTNYDPNFHLWSHGTLDLFLFSAREFTSMLFHH
jgi:hypothetical protein